MSIEARTGVELIPLRVLTANPSRSAPQLSPDGLRIAYTAPVDGVMNLHVALLPETVGEVVTHDRGRGIQNFRWAWDDRHLLYLQDVDGDENYHLHAVDIVTGVVRDLTPLSDVRVQIAGLSPRHPDALLAQINAEVPSRLDLYRIAIPSGELVKVAEGQNFARWLVDLELRGRGGLRPREDGGIELSVRDDDTSPWRVLWAAGPDEDDALSTALVDDTWLSADGMSIYLSTSKGTDTRHILRVDARTGHVLEVVVEDDRHDVIGVQRDPVTALPRLASVERDHREWIVIDRSLGPDWAAARMLADSDADVELVSRDRSDRLWILSYATASSGATYRLFDRESGTAAELWDSRPDLAPYTLAPVEPFAFTASDGLEITGYTTFPVGVERRSLTTVMLVHGGPIDRDSWELSPRVQLLANRGYLVVQVNYRGSWSFGRRFIDAGKREWAGKMHRDVIEAAEWAVAHGYADRERIAIMGGSYGGYEALVGVSFTPEFFKCAVSMYGPCNLITLSETIPPYWIAEKRYFEEHIGRLDADRELMWERSPLRLADQIRVPVLLIYGERDPRIKISEGVQIREALERSGVDFQYVTFPDEGHGFVRPENNFKALQLSERFLAKHLGGRAEG